jgi:hypothetical protein
MARLGQTTGFSRTRKNGADISTAGLSGDDSEQGVHIPWTFSKIVSNKEFGCPLPRLKYVYGEIRWME